MSDSVTQDGNCLNFFGRDIELLREIKDIAMAGVFQKCNNWCVHIDFSDPKNKNLLQAISFDIKSDAFLFCSYLMSFVYDCERKKGPVIEPIDIPTCDLSGGEWVEPTEDDKRKIEYDEDCKFVGHMVIKAGILNCNFSPILPDSFLEVKIEHDACQVMKGSHRDALDSMRKFCDIASSRGNMTW